MSDYVVRVEGIGKKYTIRHGGVYGYTALRDVLSEGAGKLARRIVRREPGDDGTREEFWAIRDVSFDLHDGDRLGLIGRNGAGKSTLLKILSRITEPTEGRVRLRGGVASLLEVGTGFHPELTGRENIYLNGTILGMKRAEIRRKFDEIVAFAEIEKFLDTPVKRYSSGMYVRLAFAVAAHLEQDILLVDEVLAVGDAAFQKKSLGKMGEVAREGRTVILVSHNLVAIEQLCTTALWLEGGRTLALGPAAEVVEQYNASFAPTASGTFADANVMGDGTVELVSYTVTNADGSQVPAPVTGDDILIHVRMRALAEIKRPAAGVSTWSPTGVLLTSVDTTQLGLDLPPMPAGEHVMTIRLGNVPYLPGTHRMDFSVQGPGGHIYAHVEDSITFEIAQSPLYGTSHVDRGFGAVYTEIGLDLRPVSEAEPGPDITPLAPVSGRAGPATDG